MFFILSLFVFVYWLVRGSDVLIGFLFLTKDLKPVPRDPSAPKVSIIFSARDEEKNIALALKSMLSQDYSDFEVIAVNDRSQDGTKAALEAFKDEKLRVLDIKSLPKGWLGKNHALWEASKIARGEWLIFTDADIQMHPGTLSAAVAAAQKEGLGHFTLFPGLIIKGYLEAMFTNFFALIFNMRFRPWTVGYKNSKSYVGIGAFNMVKKTAYEKAGTHERIRLDIADDMMLGRIVKESGFKSACYYGMEFISVRWVEGVGGVMNALHKNAFRGVNFNTAFLLVATAGMFLTDIFPFFALFFLKDTAFWLDLAAIFMIFCLYLSGTRYQSFAWSVFPAHAFASLLFLFVMWRSAWVTWREGGVRWRDTFYSLDELSKEPM